MSHAPPDPPAATPEPTLLPAAAASHARLDALDLLRGVAILGIFLMNTQSILLPQQAYTNPAVYGEFSGRQFWAYVFTNIFADMKFITIFSFLFGAGIVLQGERVASRGMSAAAVHYKRMTVLLIFGLIHAYAIWYGDILTTYACCGLLLYPLKRLPAGWLVGIGLLMVLVEIPLTSSIMRGHYHYWPVEPIQNYHARMTQGMNDHAETVAYTGPIAGEFRYRAWMSWDLQTTGFALWTFWRCGGCILIGMGLHRWRFFHGEWGKPAYQALAIFGIGVGWAMTALGIAYNEDAAWDPTYLWTLGLDFNYLGSLITALGYMAVGVLVAQWAAASANPETLEPVLGPIRAVGKTAMSNYVFQSLVGTTLAYAHMVSPGVNLGFGLFAKLSRAQLLPIVVIVWVVQLGLSTLWLRHFRQGPLEWLWHKLVYLGSDRGSDRGTDGAARQPSKDAAPGLTG